jgi:CheY-like chemotaxis protein
MPKGGVLHVVAENVTVTPQEALPLTSGDYVKIMVRDHGVGIPEDILPRIFDPYFSTKHKGSGLGLATSFSIIKNHEGFITVESSQGIGTTFHVYLPASRKQLEMSSELDESMVDRGGKMLVMDDEDAVRRVAGEILSTLGYEVALARDGAEAIRLYQMARDSSRPFDAVLLDLTVPGGMGGAEALERLREIDPWIKAIVSSGYSHDPIMADYATYGFKAVVAKPYTVQDLRSVLRRVMIDE